MVETIRWDGKCLWVLDQRKLPHEVTYFQCRTVADIGFCISEMLVRGAPAIGVTAAYGMAIAASAAEDSGQPLMTALKEAGRTLSDTRPTAVNLFWAIAEMETSGSRKDATAETITARANELYRADIASCRSIGKLGGALLPAEGTVLTHCNAGALATAGYGTALGVIRGAIEAGKRIRVFADETRPFLQGARLTAWELLEDHIDTTLITDNMAAYFMASGEIDAVVVGADRIAANGDTANKIGTYSVALAAHAHSIPFYVAAPLSTIDMSLPDGGKIPIEERNTREVSHMYGQLVTDPRVQIRNPAFDVTPNHLITAIITDVQVIRPPFEDGLAAVFKSADPLR